MERLEGANYPDPVKLPSGLPDDGYVPVSLGQTLNRMAQQHQNMVEIIGEKDRRIFDLELEKEHLRELAYTDPLTGLWNRNGFKEAAKDFFEHAAPDTPIAILMFDLNNFKSVNDKYGHDVGDKVLVETANFLTAHVRGDDLVARGLTARIGGDEFLMVADLTPRDEQIGHSPEERSQILKHRLTSKYAEYVQQDDTLAKTGLGLSAGSALYQPDRTFEELLREADKSMFTDKDQSKRSRVAQAGFWKRLLRNLSEARR